jgi:hypothetical protein
MPATPTIPFTSGTLQVHKPLQTGQEDKKSDEEHLQVGEGRLVLIFLHVGRNLRRHETQVTTGCRGSSRDPFLTI